MDVLMSELRRISANSAVLGYMSSVLASGICQQPKTEKKYKPASPSVDLPRELVVTKASKAEPSDFTSGRHRLDIRG